MLAANKEANFLIPQELIDRDQWVLWKLVPVIDKKTGKNRLNRDTGEVEYTKVPYQINGYKAVSTDPKTWTSYNEAVEIWQKSKEYNGVGFVLSKDDPFTFIDIDNCIKNGKMSAEALSIMKSFDSFTEYSQSGEGLHIFIRGKKPGDRSKNTKKGIEMYDSGRFAVMTGNLVEGMPADIHERQEILNYTYEFLFAKEQAPALKRQSNLNASPKMEDQEILNIAFKAKNRAKFKTLYSGKYDSYPSQSEADQALCNLIAFYTQDPVQIDRIFTSSGLYRDKWDREDYKSDTIQEAIGLLKTTYQKPSAADDFQLHIMEDTSQNVHPGQFFNENNKFLHHEFSCYLAKKENIIKLDDRLHVYRKGRYIADDSLIKRKMIEIIPSLKETQLNEVMARLKLIAEVKEHAASRYIGVKNGVYDLKENKLIKHSPNFVITNQINANYDPKTKCEHIDRLFTTISDNDPEVEMLLKEMIGYTLFRENSFEKSFLLKGEGGNGKSTLFKAIYALLGEENISALSLSDLGERFNTGTLHGKLANIGDDIPYTSIKDTSVFKKLSTGDLIKGEFKGETPFQFRSFAKLIFATNRLPRLYDSSQGLKDRLVIVPLNARIRGSEKQDPFFGKKITTEKARSYLLNIGIEALRRLLVIGGFTLPKVVKRTLQEFEVGNNPVVEWLHEYYQDGKDIDGMPISYAYSDYVNFCESNHYKRPLSKKALTTELEQLGYTSDRKTVNGKTTRVYLKEVA